MSIEESAAKVDEHLAKALELAAVDKTDFVPLLQSAIDTHPAAIELAKTENLLIGQRLRDPRLLAFVDAIDLLTVAGMADSDQDHAMHAQIINAVHHAHDISAAVDSREYARLPPRC